MIGQKHFLEVAANLASEMGHTYVGTEHFLLAILKEKNPNAANLFEKGMIECIGQGTPCKTSNSDMTPSLRDKIRECRSVPEFIYSVNFNLNTGAGKILKRCNISLLDETGTTENNNSISKDMTLKSKNDYISLLTAFDCECKEISQYARNLNLLALTNKLNPTYNREDEVEKVKTILLRRTKPNPLLIGVAGCGKTAIVEELARSYVNDHLNGENAPVIYDLSLNALVSGAKYRGSFEERLEAILDCIKKHNNIILFIDEIHSLNEVGASEGATSAGQILKPALARGDIRCIGATTTSEYNKYIATDKALARRFATISVNQLSGDSKTNCIKNIVSEYGEYFKINVTEVSVQHLQYIAENVLSETIFPDNVIDIVDECLAIAKYHKKEKITNEEINQVVNKQYGILVI